MKQIVDLDIAFVILHYNTVLETKNLVSSIKKRIDTMKYYIIIVDNYSPNKSGLQLLAYYKGDRVVKVILNQNNIGYAKGNNVGISYCREHFNVKYICCLNNDTLIIQSDFFKRIDNEYNRSYAALIGPRIVLKNYGIQTSALKLKSITEYEKEYNCYMDCKQNKIDISLKDTLKRKFPKIFYYYSIVKNDFMGNRLLFRQENVILHGCCVIFTKMFFEKLNGFNEKTFLFREEELLYIALIKNSLLSVYNPRIKIKHLEDAATNSVTSGLEDKKQFVKQYQLESLNILINELKGK